MTPKQRKMNSSSFSFAQNIERNHSSSPTSIISLRNKVICFKKKKRIFSCSDRKVNNHVTVRKLLSRPIVHSCTKRHFILTRFKIKQVILRYELTEEFATTYILYEIFKQPINTRTYTAGIRNVGTTLKKWTRNINTRLILQLLVNS